MNEFYVGYLPKAPPALARWVLRVVVTLISLGIGIALLLLIGQSTFAPSRFEFLQYRDYEGIVLDSPYPTLLTPNGKYLLVAPGKHGAEDLLRGAHSRSINLRGSLIERGANRMLELDPQAIRIGDEVGVRDEAVILGPIALTGEIVDSKCFLGVMNPGDGKVHGDCATRCISGGIPPSFLVRDASGGSRVLLLTGADGRKLNREILDFIAQPIEIRGELARLGNQLILRANPSAFRRVSGNN
jgi:hypothetical protein